MGFLTPQEAEKIDEITSDIRVLLRWSQGCSKPFKEIIKDAIAVPGDWGFTDEEMKELFEKKLTKEK